MLIRGHIDHVHISDLDTRRGTVSLTSVWQIGRAHV